jgi:hypothetical protein
MSLRVSRISRSSFGLNESSCDGLEPESAIKFTRSSKCYQHLSPSCANLMTLGKTRCPISMRWGSTGLPFLSRGLIHIWNSGLFSLMTTVLMVYQTFLMVRLSERRININRRPVFGELLVVPESTVFASIPGFFSLCPHSCLLISSLKRSLSKTTL